MSWNGTAREDLHALLASNQDVLVFDVRLPLDFLTDAERSCLAHSDLVQKKRLRIHRSSQKKKTRSLTVLARVIKPVEPPCIELSLWFLTDQVPQGRAGGLEGKWAIRSSHTKNPCISTRARSSPP
jgi:hypothetical protein